MCVYLGDGKPRTEKNGGRSADDDGVGTRKSVPKHQPDIWSFKGHGEERSSVTQKDAGAGTTFGVVCMDFSAMNECAAKIAKLPLDKVHYKKRIPGLYVAFDLSTQKFGGRSKRTTVFATALSRFYSRTCLTFGKLLHLDLRKTIEVVSKRFPNYPLLSLPACRSRDKRTDSIYLLLQILDDKNIF